MVIDASALLAILLGEPDAGRFARALESSPTRLLSAATLLEAAMVIEARKGDAGGREFDLLLYRLGAEVVDVDREQAEIARRAWRTYGKGRHPAGLNYGDCFSYALAKVSGAPLLFKGDDFSQTDIRAALTT